MKLRALVFAVLSLTLFARAGAQTFASRIEQAWFLTGQVSLTVDVRLASGVHPDWAASTITIVRDRAASHTTWYDVCDELGMMVLDGNYSGKIRNHGPEVDAAPALRWFQDEKFYPISHLPSLMIYALTNKTPFGGKLGEEWTTFLAPFIGNSSPGTPPGSTSAMRVTVTARWAQ